MTALQSAKDAAAKFQLAQGLIDDVDQRIVAKQSSKNVQDGKKDLKLLAGHQKTGLEILEKVIAELSQPPVDPTDPTDPTDPDEPQLPKGSLIEIAGRKESDYLARKRVRGAKVVDTGSIKAALVAAKYGDVLQLKPGTYRGNYVLAKAGVTITHMDANRPPVMDGKIDVTANDCAVDGLVFEGDTAIKISLEADHCRAAGNWIRNRTRDDAAACIVDNGKRNLIENNLIEDCIGAAIQTGTWTDKPDGNEGWYRRNIIRGMKPGRAQGSDVIAIGLNWAGQNNVAGVVAEQNVIEDCEGAGGDIIAQQSSGNIVGANRVRKSGRLRMRGGQGNRLIRNRNEDSSIAFGGEGTEAWGNRADRIEVLGGDHEGGQPGEGTGAAIDCIAASNIGTLAIDPEQSRDDSRGSTVKPRGLKVYKHLGEIEGELGDTEIDDSIRIEIPEIDIPEAATIGPDVYWLIDPDEPDDPDPDEPDQPDEPGDPGSPVKGWVYTQDNLPGGKVGADGRKVVRSQTLTNASWMSQANTDFVDCRFVGEASTSGDRIAQDIRLINPTFEDNQGHSVSSSGHKYLFYLNMGHVEIQYDFVVFGARFKNCGGTEFMEAKGLNPSVINCDFSGARFQNGIRIRFGLFGLIVGNKNLKQITARGHNHAIVNNADSIVVFYSGTLPGNIEQWGPMHKAGGGNNMQRVECSYAAGNKVVRMGFVFGGALKYGAKANVTHPDQKVEELQHEGFRKTALDTFEDVKKLRLQ